MAPRRGSSLPEDERQNFHVECQDNFSRTVEIDPSPLLAEIKAEDAEASPREELYFAAAEVIQDQFLPEDEFLPEDNCIEEMDVDVARDGSISPAGSSLGDGTNEIVIDEETCFIDENDADTFLDEEMEDPLALSDNDIEILEYVDSTTGNAEDNQVSRNVEPHQTGRWRLLEIKPSDAVSCPHCQEKFTHLYFLVFHLKKHVKTTRIQCPDCSKRFLSKYTFELHFADLHSDSSLVQSKRCLQCPFCPRRYDKKSFLKKHLKSSRHKELLQQIPPQLILDLILTTDFSAELSESVVSATDCEKSTLRFEPDPSKSMVFPAENCEVLMSQFEADLSESMVSSATDCEVLTHQFATDPSECVVSSATDCEILTSQFATDFSESMIVPVESCEVLMSDLEGAPSESSEPSSVDCEIISDNSAPKAQCNYCVQQFARHCDLMTHLRTVHADLHFSRNLREFERRCRLVNSISSSANISPEIQPPAQVEPVLYPQEFDLRSPSGESLFQCEVCCARFYDRSELAEHSVLHSDVAPMFSHGKQQNLLPHRANYLGFACEICGVQFCDRSELAEHVVHCAHAIPGRMNNECSPRIICGICCMEFSNASLLASHLQYLHQPIPEIVQMLEQMPVNHSAPDNGKTQPSSQIIRCEFCMRVFLRRSYLNRHLKRKHPDQNHPSAENNAKKIAVQKDDRTVLKDLNSTVPVILLEKEESYRSIIPCTVLNQNFEPLLAENSAVTNQNVKPYYCQFCPSEFYRRCNLMRHLVASHSNQQRSTMASKFCETMKHGPQSAPAVECSEKRPPAVSSNRNSILTSKNLSSEIAEPASKKELMSASENPKSELSEKTAFCGSETKSTEKCPSSALSNENLISASDNSSSVIVEETAFCASETESIRCPSSALSDENLISASENSSSEIAEDITLCTSGTESTERYSSSLLNKEKSPSLALINENLISVNVSSEIVEEAASLTSKTDSTAKCHSAVSKNKDSALKSQDLSNEIAEHAEHCASVVELTEECSPVVSSNKDPMLLPQNSPNEIAERCTAAVESTEKCPSVVSDNKDPMLVPQNSPNKITEESTESHRPVVSNNKDSKLVSQSSSSETEHTEHSAPAVDSTESCLPTASNNEKSKNIVCELCHLRFSDISEEGLLQKLADHLHYTHQFNLPANQHPSILSKQSNDNDIYMNANGGSTTRPANKPSDNPPAQHIEKSSTFVNQDLLKNPFIAKLYRCGYCYEQFSTAAFLTKHLVEQHPDEYIDPFMLEPVDILSDLRDVCFNEPKIGKIKKRNERTKKMEVGNSDERLVR